MRALLLLLPSSLFFVFWGCIDEPYNVNLETISGTVYDSYGGHVPYVNVSSNNFTVFKTGENGKFMIENVLSPYNLFVSPGNFGVSPSFAAFIGITIRNSNVVTGIGSSYPNTCLLDVYFPELAEDRMLFLKFISDDFHLQFYDFPLSYGTNAVFNVYIPSTTNHISGKLIYLEYEGTYHSVYSYKRYGIKDVVLYPNQANTIIFSQDEIRFDPEERYIHITSVSPNGMQNERTTSYLYIENIYNQFRLEYDYGTYSTFTVPVLPKLKYKIKIEDSSIGQDERSLEWVYLQPGENATIVHEACPVIVSPCNNASNVTDTTTFTILDNGIPGIYNCNFRVELDSINAFSVHIYTNEKKFNLKDLMDKPYKFPSSANVRWRVYKFPNFSSMDEFVTVPYVLDSRYTSIQNSKEFKFTTAP